MEWCVLVTWRCCIVFTYYITSKWSNYAGSVRKDMEVASCGLERLKRITRKLSQDCSSNLGENKEGKQCTYNITLRRIRATTDVVIRITYSERVFLALGIQHAIHMRHICHRWTVRLYDIFRMISYTAQFFKKQLLNIKCVFWLPPTSVWNISHSKKKCGRYNQKCIFFHEKYQLFLSAFHENWIF